MEQIEINIPDDWENHQEYADSAIGVIASFRRRDWEYVVDVVEVLGTDKIFRVDLLMSDPEAGETLKIDNKDIEELDELEDVFHSLIEQCN